MNDYRPSDRDVSRAIRSWLHEDRHEDASRVAGAVLDKLDTTRRRRTTLWPARRESPLTKLFAIGIGAAAMIVALVVGARLLGPPAPASVGAAPSPTAAPTTAPSLNPDLTLAERTVTLSSATEPLPNGIASTVTIPAGWGGEPRGGFISKGGLKFAGLMGPWHEPLYVYGDPCRWSTTTPETPATTVDEVVAALASQASRDASTPVDVTLDGYPGKKLTLHVPEDLDMVEDAMEATFRDCDQGLFGSWGARSRPEPLPGRFNQLPGQIDEVWIVDIDGRATVIDGMYYPETPAEDVAELRAIIESIDFEP